MKKSIYENVLLIISIYYDFSEVVPYTGNESTVTVAKSRNAVKRYIFDDYAHEITPIEKFRRWSFGSIRVHAPKGSSCQECEEDLDIREHYS